MVGASQALARRPGVPAVGGRVVVLTADEAIPQWVTAWCRRTHRDPEVRRMRHAPGQQLVPWVVEHVRAVAGLTGEVVLLIRPDLTCGRPACVAVAVRDLDAEADVLAHAAQVAAESAAYLIVMHAVPWSFGERSVGLDAALEHGRLVVAAAAHRVATAEPGVPVVPNLIRAHPHEAVGEGVHADLLVLGGPRRGGAGPGLVIRSALQHAPCPVLLVPRGS
jgi:nucleotide-binding universal stress UspA family protein